MDRDEVQEWVIPVLRKKSRKELNKIEEILEKTVPDEVIRYLKPAYLQALKFFEDQGATYPPSLLDNIMAPRMALPPGPWRNKIPPQFRAHPLSPFTFWERQAQKRAKQASAKPALPLENDTPVAVEITCPSCGASSKPGNKFCENCGSTLN
ncbi:MAG TPA: zinc-ribbon domain-containing protein [Candidatus Lokiarchaeia archaeon]|nr:zinc-ribbon domain-containing protein [Candidatus Lokiarchaeia archaeon]